MLEIGQEVVCVNVQDGNLWDDTPYACGSRHLQKGRVYVIQSFETLKGELFLHLHGVRGGWHHTRFRPVVKKKTDISIFTAMLKTDKVTT